jgi:hypothetical protein
MRHLICKGFKCEICNTTYEYIDCTTINTLPSCCKSKYLCFDHLHLYDKDFNDIGQLRYNRDDYGNLYIVLEFDNFFEYSPKCLCDAKELLKRINHE